jgi:hypothetical protein
VCDRCIHQRPPDFHRDLVEDVVDGFHQAPVNNGHEQRRSPDKVLGEGAQVFVLEAGGVQACQERHAIN